MRKRNNPNKKMVGKTRFSLLFVLLGFILLATNAYSQNRYWKGGAAGSGPLEWSNVNRWSSVSSTDMSVATPPVAGDNVIIDVGSAVTTINLDVATAFATLSWVPATGTLNINNGQSINATGNVTMNGTLVGGNNTTTTWGGATNVFGNPVTFGTNTTASFAGINTFNDNVAVGGTIGAAVTFNNATFKGLVNQFLGRFNFTGTATFDVNSVNTFGGGAFNKTFADVIIKEGATFDLQTAFPATDQFANITLESSSTIKFNGLISTNTIVSGKIVVNTTICTSPAKYATITSNFGLTTSIDFGTDQEWNNVIVNQIQNVSLVANIKVKSAGAALPMALGIEDWTIGGRVVYWIGGTTLPAVPQNWSDCRNWATSSGGSVAGSAGVDPPISGLDTVIFDASSFTAIKNVVNMDRSATLELGTATTDLTYSATNTPHSPNSKCIYAYGSHSQCIYGLSYLHGYCQKFCVS